MRKSFLGGLGLIIVLSLFLLPTSAFAFGSYGPQTKYDDKYYYWGDVDEQPLARNGIDVVIDSTSVSYQSVKATITVDWKLIEERNIVGFAILANGVNVDMVDTYFDSTIDPPGYREYYNADFDISNQYIGSTVYFQVLGITRSGDDAYVVAWSQQTPTYTFKPFPVIDRTAITWLQSIWYKLQDIYDLLNEKLSKISDQLDKLFTPSPAAEANLDNAVQNFLDKMPMQEMAEKVQEMNDAMQDSLNQLHQPGERMTFGGKFRFMPDDPASEVDFLDLTEFRDQVMLFRTIMEATIWIFFFYGLLRTITPKTTI